MIKIIQYLLMFVLAAGMVLNIGLAAEKQPDYWPTRSWKTASPESQGVDSELLVKMMVRGYFYSQSCSEVYWSSRYALVEKNTKLWQFFLIMFLRTDAYFSKIDLKHYLMGELL